MILLYLIHLYLFDNTYYKKTMTRAPPYRSPIRKNSQLTNKNNYRKESDYEQRTSEGYKGMDEAGA